MNRLLLIETMNLLVALNFPDRECATCGVDTGSNLLKHNIKCYYAKIFEKLQKELNSLPDVCPFCGTEPEVKENTLTFTWTVKCPRCHATQDNEECLSAAIWYWNRRN